jgi:hypothetical protein
LREVLGRQGVNAQQLYRVLPLFAERRHQRDGALCLGEQIALVDAAGVE